MPRDADAWYFCRTCDARRRGRVGLMFCPDCGGDVRRIGYRTTHTNRTTKGTPRGKRTR